MTRIMDKNIGDGHPCYIVFEAGPTHNGLESALRLASAAAVAGADAIKFQVLDPDRLVADKHMEISYQVLLDKSTGETKTVSEPLYDILCRRTLTWQEWDQLSRYCEVLGLAFFATAMFEDEIHKLEEISCHSIKIASGDVNHWPLIREAAQTNMVIQLDTGNATIGEIENAVDVAVQEGCEDIIIHQCPSGYPARLESVNLRIIPTLKQMFGVPVAYSDHVPGWSMDIAAVAMGANLVEKTITEDRTTPSIEHIMSVEPQDAQRFVQEIRDLEIAMGSPRRVMSEQEKQNRLNVRRSAYIKNLTGSSGQGLSDIEVEYRRPGDGIGPDEFERLANSGAITRYSGLPPKKKLSYSDIC